MLLAGLIRISTFFEGCPSIIIIVFCLDQVTAGLLLNSISNTESFISSKSGAKCMEKEKFILIADGSLKEYVQHEVTLLHYSLLGQWGYR